VYIDTAYPSYYFQTPQTAGQLAAGQTIAMDPGISGTGFETERVPPQISRPGTGVIVDISPEAWNAYNRYIPGEAGPQEKPKTVPVLMPNGGGPRGVAEAFEAHECQTCKSRKYQDGSSDPSVSFQAPTHLSPGQAAGSVAAHEGEHVAHEQAKAEREGRKIVSQTVAIHTAICPECGRVYVSGGVTRTITANKPDNSSEGPVPAGPSAETSAV